MSRSVFEKHFTAHKNYVASRVDNNFVNVDCLVLDIVGYEGKHKSLYTGEREFRGNIYFIVSISHNKEIAAIPLRDMSYDELRANYGSDSNIIGRELLVVARSFKTLDVRNGRITFRSGYNNRASFQDDSSVNIPVSMGGMAGLEYRAEDRMFYNKNIASYPGNVWGELRPLR